MSRWIVVVGGLAGIALTLTTLYFLVFKGCDPTLSGTFGEPTVDNGVMYRDFLKITDQPPGGADKGTLELKGTVIDLPITAVGYRGKPLPVRWSILTAAGKPVREKGLSDRLALEIVPEECTDVATHKIWTQSPERAGRYLVEVVLFDDDGQPLDSQRTKSFDVP